MKLLYMSNVIRIANEMAGPGQLVLAQQYYVNVCSQDWNTFRTSLEVPIICHSHCLASKQHA